jgi:MFS superfamily sulfate permease-like transporter
LRARGNTGSFLYLRKKVIFMEVIGIVMFIAGCIAGIIVGVLCTVAFTPKKSGSLVIDSSDPSGKKLIFLEMTEKPEELMKRKATLLKIENRDYFAS